MEWKFRFLHDVLGISRAGGPMRPGTLALRDHPTLPGAPEVVPRVERAPAPADPSSARERSARE